jgi:hypothetical protein
MESMTTKITTKNDATDPRLTPDSSFSGFNKAAARNQRNEDIVREVYKQLQEKHSDFLRKFMVLKGVDLFGKGRNQVVLIRCEDGREYTTDLDSLAREGITDAEHIVTAVINTVANAEELSSLPRMDRIMRLGHE